MAVPASFNESNLIMNNPPDMSPETCEPLCVHYQEKGDSGYPEIISCWKLTQAELDEINKTGRVWVTILGLRMPPLVVNGTSPFVPATT
jgi:hypothetical protein